MGRIRIRLSKKRYSKLMGTKTCKSLSTKLKRRIKRFFRKYAGTNLSFYKSRGIKRIKVGGLRKYFKSQLVGKSKNFSRCYASMLTRKRAKY